jgi:hypothetical protein
MSISLKVNGKVDRADAKTCVLFAQYKSVIARKEGRVMTGPWNQVESLGNNC